MEAGSQDVWDWDWEVLPDQRMSHGSSKNLDGNDHGGKNLDDQETEELHDLLPPSSGDDGVDVHVDDDCKDIGVVPDETTVPSVAADDLMMASDDGDGGEEEKKAFQSPESDAKDSTAATAAAATGDDSKFAQQEEEEEGIKKEVGDKDGKARPAECVVFSVGKLKVNGIGALCSFGVAAATVCVFLIGGRLQHHHHRQQQEQHKIQLQFYGDDKRIQQVVQQTSRLNQAMSSVMGAGGGSATRANISFGGFYDGF